MCDEEKYPSLQDTIKRLKETIADLEADLQQHLKALQCADKALQYAEELERWRQAEEESQLCELADERRYIQRLEMGLPSY